MSYIFHIKVNQKLRHKVCLMILTPLLIFPTLFLYKVEEHTEIQQKILLNAYIK